MAGSRATERQAAEARLVEFSLAGNFAELEHFMSIGLPQQGDATYELAPYKSLDNAELQERIAAVRSVVRRRRFRLASRP